MERKEFMQVFIPLSEIFSKKFSDIALEMYFNVIKSEITIKQLEYAAMVILKNRKYSNFPTPAEFIEIIKGNEDEQLRVKTTEALFKFKEAIKKCCSVSFDDPYIHKTIKLMGGWNDILMRNKEQINWIEKEFCEKYEDLIKRQPKIDDIDKVLYTKRDLLQLENGLTVLEPIKIGDKTKIEKWQNALESKKQGVLVEKIY